MEITEQIRQKMDIVKVARNYTQLKKRGVKYVGLCPLHKEKEDNLSFTVNKEKQLFHCFGCGAGGDVFTLIMEKEGLNFPQTVEFLSKKYKIKRQQVSQAVELMPVEIRRAIYELINYNNGLSSRGLSDLIMKWAKDECSEKSFFAAMISFADKLKKAQDSIRNWDEFEKIDEEFSWEEEIEF